MNFKSNLNNRNASRKRIQVHQCADRSTNSCNIQFVHAGHWKTMKLNPERGLNQINPFNSQFRDQCSRTRRCPLKFQGAICNTRSLSAGREKWKRYLEVSRASILSWIANFRTAKTVLLITLPGGFRPTNLPTKIMLDTCFARSMCKERRSGKESHSIFRLPGDEISGIRKI